MPGITIGNLGNAALKPERTTETEFGFDADFRPLAIHWAFTYYNKLSHDALIAVVLPPSCGCGTSIFRNLGAVSNKGVEISAAATVVRKRNVQVDVNASAWGTRSRVKDLGPNIAPIIFGLGGATQRFQVGFAPGSYFQRPYTYADSNSDGLLSLNEVVLGATPTFQGQPFPDHGGSFSSTITLFERFHLYGLVDGRFGNRLFNSTEQFRCLPPRNTCRGLNDRTASPEDQAAAAANLKGTQAGYIQDGGFTKLREVSVTYFAPTRWAKFFGASDLSFAVVGRNLATWTKYQGVDPELNEAGQNNFTTADSLTQPPVRYFIGRVNVTF